MSEPGVIEEIDFFPDLTKEQREKFKAHACKELSGLVFSETLASAVSVYEEMYNLHLSLCFVCQQIAVWVHDRLVFPASLQVAQPNFDRCVSRTLRHSKEEFSEYFRPMVWAC
jgi:hypothetical protein